MQMELPIPTSLVDRSLLTQFHMEMMGCFTIEQPYQWRFVTVYYRHFPPDQLSQESIRLTEGDGGPSMMMMMIFVINVFRLQGCPHLGQGHGPIVSSRHRI